MNFKSTLKDFTPPLLWKWLRNKVINNQRKKNMMIEDGGWRRFKGIIADLMKSLTSKFQIININAE